MGERGPDRSNRQDRQNERMRKKLYGERSKEAHGRQEALAKERGEILDKQNPPLKFILPQLPEVNKTVVRGKHANLRSMALEAYRTVITDEEEAQKAAKEFVRQIALLTGEEAVLTKDSVLVFTGDEVTLQGILSSRTGRLLEDQEQYEGEQKKKAEEKRAEEEKAKQAREKAERVERERAEAAFDEEVRRLDELGDSLQERYQSSGIPLIFATTKTEQPGVYDVTIAKGFESAKGIIGNAAPGEGPVSFTLDMTDPNYLQVVNEHVKEISLNLEETVHCLQLGFLKEFPRAHISFDPVSFDKKLEPSVIEKYRVNVFEVSKNFSFEATLEQKEEGKTPSWTVTNGEQISKDLITIPEVTRLMVYAYNQERNKWVTGKAPGISKDPKESVAKSTRSARPSPGPLEGKKAEEVIDIVNPAQDVPIDSDPALRDLSLIDPAWIPGFSHNSPVQIENMRMSIARNLYYSNRAVIKENVQAAFKEIIDARNNYGETPLFAERNVLLLSSYGETGSWDHYGRPELEKRIRQDQGTRKAFQAFEVTSEEQKEVLEKKNMVLAAIEVMPSPMTFVFDGYGLASHVSLADHKSKSLAMEVRGISIQELAKALADRQAKGHDLSQDILIFTSCRSQEFLRNLHQELTKRGCAKPLIIAPIEYGQNAEVREISRYGSVFWDELLGSSGRQVRLKRLWEMEPSLHFDPSVFIPSEAGPVQLTQNDRGLNENSRAA